MEHTKKISKDKAAKKSQKSASASQTAAVPEPTARQPPMVPSPDVTPTQSVGTAPAALPLDLVMKMLQKTQAGMDVNQALAEIMSEFLPVVQIPSTASAQTTSQMPEVQPEPEVEASAQLEQKGSVLEATESPLAEEVASPSKAADAAETLAGDEEQGDSMIDLEDLFVGGEGNEKQDEEIESREAEREPEVEGIPQVEDTETSESSSGEREPLVKGTSENVEREPLVEGTSENVEGEPLVEGTSVLVEDVLEGDRTPRFEDGQTAETPEVEAAHLLEAAPEAEREPEGDRTPEFMEGQTAETPEVEVLTVFGTSPEVVTASETEKEKEIVLIDEEDAGSPDMPILETAQRRDVEEWIPVDPVVIEIEEEEEEVPLLHRRPGNRRLNFDEVQGVSPPVDMEIGETGPQVGESMLQVEETADQLEERSAEEERLRKEKKRKGKELEKPKKKKSRPAHTAVVIQEPVAQPTRQQVDEEEDEAEPIPQPTRRATDQAEQQTEFFRQMGVKIDNDLLQQLVQFPDSKAEEACLKRKGFKSGKCLHLESLQSLQVDAEFIAYITGIGFEWLLEINTPKVPEELAKEFFTSFRLKITDDPEVDCISFRICNRLQKMNLTEWSVGMGLFSID